MTPGVSPNLRRAGLPWQAPWAWAGVVGPLVYSWLVINVTGQATLDKKLAREKPEYADYMRRTSGLIPRPPSEA